MMGNRGRHEHWSLGRGGAANEWSQGVNRSYLQVWDLPRQHNEVPWCAAQIRKRSLAPRSPAQASSGDAVRQIWRSSRASRCCASPHYLPFHPRCLCLHPPFHSCCRDVAEPPRGSAKLRRFEVPHVSVNAAFMKVIRRLLLHVSTAIATPPRHHAEVFPRRREHKEEKVEK
jgi:hypothetical protein